MVHKLKDTGQQPMENALVQLKNIHTSVYVCMCKAAHSWKPCVNKISLRSHAEFWFAHEISVET